jgi:hypothetical protein
MKWKTLATIALIGATFLASQGFNPSNPAREYIYFRGKLIAMESLTSQAPAPVDYSPPGGTFSGPGGVFKVRISDPNGAANLYQTNIMLGTNLDPATTCFAYYHYLWSNIYLYEPGTGTWSAPMSLAPGSSGPTQLDSTRCTLYKANSGSSFVPNQPTVAELSLNITIKNTVANPINIWTWTSDLQGNYAWWSILPPQSYTRVP